MCRAFFRCFLCCFAGALSLFFTPVGMAQPVNSLPLAHSFSGAYLAGRIAESNHDMQAAVAYFRKALNFEPDNEEIKQDLFLLLLGSGQFEQSFELARDLIDHPDVGRFSRLVLAADAFNKGKFDTIEEDVLVFDDDGVMEDLVATLIAAWELFAQGDEADAIAKTDMLSGPAWYDMFRDYNLALLSSLMEKNEAAEAAFQTIFANREGAAPVPDTYERALIAYAAFKLAMGDRQAAIKILEQGELLLSGRGVFSQLRQDVMKGGTLLPLVTSPDQGAAEALYTIGSALNRSGMEVYGRLYLHIALALRPLHDATLFQLAELDNKMGAHEEAIDYYRQITADSFYFRDANIRLALTLAQTQREKEAIALLEDLLAKYSQDEDLVMTLAGIYMQIKDFSAVVDMLSPYMQKEEGASHWRFFYQRGIAYERLNMWDKAKADFCVALRLEPDQPQVLNYLGYSLIDRNLKLDEALEMVAQAVSLRPQDGYIADSLGWAYYKLGRYSQAVEELERAVRLRPEDATINDHLGDAYWRVGRRLEARFQWNHAVEGKPEAQELEKIEEKLKNGLQDIPNDE